MYAYIYWQIWEVPQMCAYIYWQIQEIATHVCAYLLADPGGSHGCMYISTGRSGAQQERCVCIFTGRSRR